MSRFCWPVNILKIQSFEACVVEMNLVWNLKTGTGRLTLYYDQLQNRRMKNYSQFVKLLIGCLCLHVKLFLLVESNTFIFETH